MVSGICTDIVVIGAGIAGASAAAELAAHATVTLLEMEGQPGYHATGRSAAFFAPSYGNEVVRGITAMSEPFLRNAPPGFSEVPLLRPRDCVFVGREDQRERLATLRADIPVLEALEPGLVRERVPILAPDFPAQALVDMHGGDLDVDALLQGYLRLFRQRGGEVFTNCEVTTLVRRQGLWLVSGGGVECEAPIVVNAAGAWADSLAVKAGLAGVGITPMRRTACLVDAPPGLEIGEWPMVVDADEQFYFKPEAGALLISPADEIPSPACDAQADELDIAIAIDRVVQVTSLEVRRINHRWAGLRSFAPDKTFVAGFDPRAEGFFWLAGQGGYGVQSAPGMAKLTDHLVTGATLSGNFAGLERFVDAVSPRRLL